MKRNDQFRGSFVAGLALICAYNTFYSTAPPPTIATDPAASLTLPLEAEAPAPGNAEPLAARQGEPRTDEPVVIADVR